MPILTTAIMNLIVVLAIGIAAGIIFARRGRTWLGQLGGSGSAGEVTSALVGIAGAFMGFHLVVVLGLLPTPLMLYLGAVVGAVVTLWLWRGR